MAGWGGGLGWVYLLKVRARFTSSIFFNLHFLHEKWGKFRFLVGLGGLTHMFG